MTTHETGTREEWLAARLELLEAEKELTRGGDELARRRQELPWVRIDKPYRFGTDEGTASLAGLFRGASQQARADDAPLNWFRRHVPPSTSDTMTGRIACGTHAVSPAPGCWNRQTERLESASAPS